MPAPIDGKLRLQPEERRRLLLQAAAIVYADKGISSGGHTEIAEVSGVSVPTVFNYFKTREIIVEEVLKYVAEFHKGVIDRVFGSSTAETSIVTIHEYGEELTKLALEKPEMMKVWLQWSGRFYEEAWPVYEDSVDYIQDQLASKIDLAVKTRNCVEVFTFETACDNSYCNYSGKAQNHRG